ncbi:Pr6Pr family membrane protein [Streptomyces chiangmaiensis]|uniref:Pr6Pr family membrane protein n=1 Tax=Streptomyces chiangmaiensis TaxID=766497 RepID=A0ABU7FLC4_9ACTN|nr:Pr6Pr family membrane protein [Streptomyces chiangmaiensis]MED7824900.1 Pr6Pr family membrane protein [Streptomyces chiangmaiensis]
MIPPIPKEIPDLPAVPSRPRLRPSFVPPAAVVAPTYRPMAAAYRLLVALTAAAAVTIDLLIGNPVRVLTHFAVQTNVLIAVVFALSAWRSSMARRPLPSLVTGGTLFYALIAGLVYHMLLLNEPGPFSLTSRPDVHTVWAALAGQVIHTVTPIAVLLDWLLLMRPATLTLRQARTWLLYPMAYLAASLVRGELILPGTAGRYLYPFLDVGRLGYRSVLANALLLGLAFFALAVLLVALDHIRPDPTRRRRRRRLRKTGFRL